ncbi:MAG: type VII toxin-antitoxin system HepT family RNase toxin [Chloroflexota bacterium]
MDCERLLVKIDQLEGYIKELRQIVPEDFEGYQQIEKRRSCERLLQVSIEAVIDICRLLVTGLRLGLPSEEDEVFEKLKEAAILSPQTLEVVREMKAFRNIIVHEYTRIDDRIVYQMAKTRLDDFRAFEDEVLSYLSKEDSS